MVSWDEIKRREAERQAVKALVAVSAPRDVDAVWLLVGARRPREES